MYCGARRKHIAFNPTNHGENKTRTNRKWHSHNQEHIYHIWIARWELPYSIILTNYLKNKSLAIKCHTFECLHFYSLLYRFENMIETVHQKNKSYHFDFQIFEQLEILTGYQCAKMMPHHHPPLHSYPHTQPLTRPDHNHKDIHKKNLLMFRLKSNS